MLGRDNTYPMASSFEEVIFKLRAEQFPNLKGLFFFFFLFIVIASILSDPSPSADMVYLDHAGSTPYAECQLKSSFAELSDRLYGNPRE